MLSLGLTFFACEIIARMKFLVSYPMVAVYSANFMGVNRFCRMVSVVGSRLLLFLSWLAWVTSAMVMVEV